MKPPSLLVGRTIQNAMTIDAAIETRLRMMCDCASHPARKPTKPRKPPRRRHIWMRYVCWRSATRSSVLYQKSFSFSSGLSRLTVKMISCLNSSTSLDAHTDSTYSGIWK